MFWRFFIQKGANIQIELSGSIYYMDSYPDCPYCHRSVNPVLRTFNFIVATSQVRLVLMCPHQHCSELFFGRYYRDGYSLELFGTTVGNFKAIKINEEVSGISPAFPIIYNEAYFAEQNNLKEICGVGYRKALEFLIKDYCITLSPEKKEQIEKDLLGKVIDKYVTNLNIKEIAKRAVWLGNDETHYVRKWEHHDLQDLKNLIAVTLFWIQMEVTSKNVIESMQG